MDNSEMASGRQLGQHISPAGAWAYSVGTAIGWGSLVITANNYLSFAGPLGSALGMLIGMAIMLIIARNYHYLMNSFPEAGGGYAYAREVFGYDHGFLTAWFLALIYLAILWANATSLPLFARYFLGDLFHFARLYALFGYDVYLGEALLSMAALGLTALLCARGKKLSIRLMIGLAGLLTGGIAVCFIGALLGGRGDLSPAWVPDGKALSQVIHIACISPWAFIGFESLSHATEEFSFSRKRSFRVLAVAVITTTALYVCVTLLSVTAYPPQYASWLEYIRDLGNLSGIEGLPAFYAARHYLGAFGVTVLMLSLLALILTSLIGNTFAVSRLFYALAKDGVLPRRFAEVNDREAPGKAIGLAAGLSMLIPFLGRTAIGWIVDVTTLGATIIYGLISAAAMKLAREQHDRLEQGTGGLGLIVMAGFLLYLTLPSLFSAETMEAEALFLFAVWSLLGFIYFRQILKRDANKRFGKSIVVWIGLLTLILFTSLVWLSQSTIRAASVAMGDVQTFYGEAGLAAGSEGVVSQAMSGVQRTIARGILFVIVMFGLSLVVLINNYTLMSRRAQQSEAALGHMMNVANTDPLTGVKSKHAFVEWEKKLDGRIADGTAEPFAVIVCDVNGLKHINDTYGHKAGDEYIRAASHLICETFQHSPVFRIGGDEFVVITSGRDYEARQSIMDGLNARVEANIGGEAVVVSVGLSEYEPGQDVNMYAAFERADKRMYRRKQELKAMGARTRE